MKQLMSISNYLRIIEFSNQTVASCLLHLVQSTSSVHELDFLVGKPREAGWGKLSFVHNMDRDMGLYSVTR